MKAKGGIWRRGGRKLWERRTEKRQRGTSGGEEKIKKNTYGSRFAKSERNLGGKWRRQREK